MVPDPSRTSLIEYFLWDRDAVALVRGTASSPWERGNAPSLDSSPQARWRMARLFACKRPPGL